MPSATQCLGAAHGHLFSSCTACCTCVWSGLPLPCVNPVWNPPCAPHSVHRHLADCGRAPALRPAAAVSYMPPELVMHQKLSPAVDVYSFGVVRPLCRSLQYRCMPLPRRVASMPRPPDCAAPLPAPGSCRAPALEPHTLHLRRADCYNTLRPALSPACAAAAVGADDRHPRMGRHELPADSGCSHQRQAAGSARRLAAAHPGAHTRPVLQYSCLACCTAYPSCQDSQGCNELAPSQQSNRAQCRAWFALPTPAQSLVARCLDSDPRQRPSAKQVLEELEGMLASSQPG